MVGPGVQAGSLGRRHPLTSGLARIGWPLCAGVMDLVLNRADYLQVTREEGAGGRGACKRLFPPRTPVESARAEGRR